MNTEEKILKQFREKFTSKDAKNITENGIPFTDYWKTEDIESFLRSTITSIQREERENNKKLRNKLIDNYIQLKGESIPNELADLALKVTLEEIKKKMEYFSDWGEENDPFYMEMSRLVNSLQSPLENQKKGTL